MFETTTGQQDRHIAVVVVRRIAQIAGQKDGRLIQQPATVVFTLLQASHELPPLADDGCFHQSKLRELFFVTTMMTESVIPLLHAFDGNHASGAGDVQGNEPRRVRLQRKLDDIEHHFQTSDQVTGITDIDRLPGVDFRLGKLCPVFVLCHPFFQLANAGEVSVETIPVTSPQFTLQRPGVFAHDVHDAAPLANPGACRRRCWGESSINSCANNREGESCGGIIAPFSVYEGLVLPPVLSTSEGNRVASPRCFARN